jgi:hypothetical protein
MRSRAARDRVDGPWQPLDGVDGSSMLCVVGCGYAKAPRNRDGCGVLSYVVHGGVLLSHTLSGAVPSALEGLASGFGMGPGVSPPLWPP